MSTHDGEAHGHDVVDAALNRLFCDLALDPDGPVADMAVHVSELAASVAALESPSLDALITEVAAAGDARTLERRLTAFAKAFHAVNAATEPHPPLDAADASTGGRTAASQVDEDVAALRGDPELAGMFIEEALDHLGTIEASILQFEAAPGDSKLLNDIFRPFHTVKGNAGVVGVTRVQELAHKVENLLDLCRSGQHPFGPAETDVALEAVDVLSALVHDLKARLGGKAGTDLEPQRRALMARVQALVSGSGDAPQPAAAASAPPPVSPAPTPTATATTVAVPVPGPALAPAAVPAPTPTAAATPAATRAATPTVADAAAHPSPSRRSEDISEQASVKVDTRKLDNLVDMVGELVIAQSILQEDPAFAGAVDERLTRNLAQLKRITSDLQKNAMSMRMVPIRQTFQKMARLVRDLSKKSGKQVDLVWSGEETELDRRVVEDINDPLMHMVRNSVDHGIEDAAQRIRNGKSPEGRLALSAYHQGGNIVIAIEDDGAGLNTERILTKAVSQGLVQPGETLPTSEIYQLIFKPGFSTAEKVTEISGRGVGMDVVRRNIDALRGRIEIQSTPGRGTTFLIKLPLTLAILDGLLLGVGSERFVMPIVAVRESLRPLPGQVHTVKGVPRMVQVRTTLVPLVWLADICGLEPGETDVCQSTVVVIEDDGHQVGLVVDRLLGKQEVVIKSLGDTFGHVAGVAGGAILGDGRVGLILDAHGIVGRTRRDAARAA